MVTELAFVKKPEPAEILEPITVVPDAWDSSLAEMVRGIAPER